jgi:NAD(P)H dehydrogenase (quinone)
MADLLITYHSRGGNTRAMGESIAEGASAVEGVEVDLRPVAEVRVQELLDYDGVVIGSPTYYGLPSANIKKLLDESVAFHGQLEGKVGGAFASSANIGGGNETTILALLEALLIHGMVVQGTATGDHYGPVSIGAPDRRANDQCRAYGQRIATLTKSLHG